MQVRRCQQYRDLWLGEYLQLPLCEWFQDVWERMHFVYELLHKR
jgi:hypothetical protein